MRVIISYILLWMIFVFQTTTINHIKEPVLSTDKDFSFRMKKYAEISDSLYFMRTSDKPRIYDCDKSSGVAYKTPLGYYNTYLGIFGDETKVRNITGFRLMNQTPSLVSFYNLNNVTENSGIFIGIRGLSWGIHKAHIINYVSDMIDSYYPTGLGLFFDNYKFIGKDHTLETGSIIASCHNRLYYDGYHMPSNSPSLDNNENWKYISSMFSEQPVYIFGFSNGYAQIDQYLNETPDNYSNLRRIKAIVNVETNFGKKEIENLAAMLHMRWSKDKLFYATVNIDFKTVWNHIFLIRALDLKGFELENGVVRYVNEDKSIIIDILAPCHVCGGVNLPKDAPFEPYGQIKRRLKLNHFAMLEYTFNHFIYFTTKADFSVVKKFY